VSAASAPPPKKRLGQHFLIDPNIVRKIVSLAAPRSDETVFEIGPGRGALTRALCAASRSVVAVEVDRQLTEYLTRTLTDCPNLDLRHGDALSFPLETIPEGSVVVANLPYYISAPLLFKLLEMRGRIDRMVLMLQTEVARRIVARPHTKEYGVLAVLAQYWTEPVLAFRIPSTCFQPRPEVESAVVKLAVRRRPAVAVQDEDVFLRLVRGAFAHRRKTLVNSLRDEGFAGDAVNRAMTAAGIDPVRRAETLSLQEFAVLADAFARARFF
jgi:16S rRNA (adenine1518-N6/adenine1519-N6)-dimethyltransferase